MDEAGGCGATHFMAGGCLAMRRHQDYLKHVTRGIAGWQTAQRIRVELEGHLHECEEELMAQGLSPAEAAIEARRRLGDPEMLAVMWRRFYYTAWLNWATLLGFLVGSITGTEPWWMSGGGLAITWQADIVEGAALGLAGIAVIQVARQWRKGAWTGSRWAALSFVLAFWLTALGVSGLIGFAYPMPPAGVTDWYNGGYIRHLAEVGSLVTGSVSFAWWNYPRQMGQLEGKR